MFTSISRGTARFTKTTLVALALIATTLGGAAYALPLDGEDCPNGRCDYRTSAPNRGSDLLNDSYYNSMREDAGWTSSRDTYRESNYRGRGYNNAGENCRFNELRGNSRYDDYRGGPRIHNADFARDLNPRDSRDFNTLLQNRLEELRRSNRYDDRGTNDFLNFELPRSQRLPLDSRDRDYRDNIYRTRRINRDDYRTNDYRNDDYRSNDYRNNDRLTRDRYRDHLPAHRLPSDYVRPSSYTPRNDYRDQPSRITPLFDDPRYNDDRYEQPLRIPSPVPANRPSELSETEQIQQHLSHRYSNPTVQRFIRSVSPQTAMSLYQEASQLIDSRHLQPTSYQARVERAAQNLVQACRNSAFLNANQLRPTNAQIQSFENALANTIRSARIDSQQAASNMVYQVANLATQQLRIPATTTVLEFVYASAESLDKYSTFLPEEQSAQSGALIPAHTKTARTGLEDSIVGIGVEIKPHADGVEVVKALRGGPAQAAGVQKGDIIVGINGRSLAGQGIDFAVDQIKGPAGSPVYLSLSRSGRATPVTLQRAHVRVYSVSEVKMIGSSQKVGYIRLDKFAQSSTEEVDQALWQLHRQGMQSLVFDLRGNPGGLLTTAVELCNKFLPSGTIVSTRGRTQADHMQETASNTQTWKVPLVVLVDGDSASASEIFAAAIKENNRGIIVGRQSYGKGTVQTHFPLRAVAGNLKLTTAKFYSPQGREMAGAGVVPDVQVRTTNFGGNGVNNADRDIEVAVTVAESGRAQEIVDRR